jgi:hypothetical protein
VNQQLKSMRLGLEALSFLESHWDKPVLGPRTPVQDFYQHINGPGRPQIVGCVDTAELGFGGTGIRRPFSGDQAYLLGDFSPPSMELMQGSYGREVPFSGKDCIRTKAVSVGVGHGRCSVILAPAAVGIADLHPGPFSFILF